MLLFCKYCTVHYIQWSILQYITVVHYLVRKYCTVLMSVNSNGVEGNWIRNLLTSRLHTEIEQGRKIAQFGDQWDSIP
jgi:hypothetical protein